MHWFKHQFLSWIILSAAAVCVSCQDLSSTLREGNHTCPGEEVFFTCTIRGSQTLRNLILTWISTEYIQQGVLLQFTTEDESGAMELSGNVVATLTKNTEVDGVPVLESTLHLVADVASMVTCTETNGGSASVEFTISAVPGVPQNVGAAEVSEPISSFCIILVTWNHPANSNGSDIDHYILTIPSQNIKENETSSVVSISLSNCGDIRIQVAAVNLLGCEGPRSTEIEPVLLSIPTETRADSTTESGSASASSQFGVSAIVGIAIGVIVIFTFAVVLVCVIIRLCCLHFKNLAREGVQTSRKSIAEDVMESIKTTVQLQEKLKCISGGDPKYCFLNLYIALRSRSRRKMVNPEIAVTPDSFMINAVVTVRAALKKTEATVIKHILENSLETIKLEEKESAIQGAFRCLIELISDNNMLNADDVLKSKVKELREIVNEISEEKLDNLKEEIEEATPDIIQKILLNLCDILLEKLQKLPPEQEEVVGKFKISEESLREMETLLTAEFVEGLKREGDDVRVKMFNTCVHKMPDGTEEGEFLVLDLEVSYLRVLCINVHRGRITKKDSVMFLMDERTENSSSHEDLLDFVASRVAKFMKDKKITKKLPIVFVFPFPVKQESLNSGKIIHWGNFKTIGAEGMDIVELLEAAFDRQEVINVGVVVLVNHTTAIQLAAGIYCRVGLLLGEGTNACYTESLDAVPKLKGDHKHYSCVIINTEWGAFGDDGKLNKWRTNYDCQVDNESANRGQQLFEKMITGKYLGEILRHALNDLISKKQLFGGKSPSKFDVAGALSIKRLSVIENGVTDHCKNMFRNKFSIEASDQDCEVVRRVCEAVSTRAARLIAVGVVALVKKTDKISGCDVAIESSLYKRHPKFADRMKTAIDELAPENKINMKLTTNGPAQSAAFAAAMACHLTAPRECKSPGGRVESASMQGQRVSIQQQEDTRGASVAMMNRVPMGDQQHTYNDVHPLAVNIELEENPHFTVWNGGD